MQELKCGRCGADLETFSVDGEGLYGRCTHCKTTYLITEDDRRHVVVDVRVPPTLRTAPVPAAAAVTRRTLLLTLGGIAAAGGVGALLIAPPRHRPGGTRRKIKPVWNIGGKGPGPGQFRTYISTVTIDGQGRSAVVMSQSPVVQLFDAQGRFLARWNTATDSAMLLAALPGGDLIFDAADGYERRDPMTGTLAGTMAFPDIRVRSIWRKAATTPDGGVAFYYSSDPSGRGDDRKAPPDDHLVYYGPDGAPGRTIGPLIGRIFRPDPALPKYPEVAALAIDGAGTVYLLFRKQEEYDTREGLYAFTPDGVLLRKIEIEQKFYGMLAATADGALFHADPWSTTLTRIRGAATSRIDIADLDVGQGEGLGMPFEIAAFPDGDLAVATAQNRYVRIHWPEQG